VFRVSTTLSNPKDGGGQRIKKKKKFGAGLNCFSPPPCVPPPAGDKIKTEIRIIIKIIVEYFK
jgi:hypothetical protein